MTAPAAAIETLSGGAVRAAVPELARLRVEVFRDWPYLYDGDLAYERRYLAKYAGIEDATIVVARVGGRIVGASTALPLAKAEPEMQRPFRDAGLDPRDWYYFGESVLEAAHRGRGIGVAFFRAREERAAALGYRRTTFCAVERPEDHPLRPAGHVPLDAFWMKRGYRKVDGLTGEFSWRDVGETTKTKKPMQFWMKAL